MGTRFTFQYNIRKYGKNKRESLFDTFRQDVTEDFFPFFFTNGLEKGSVGMYIKCYPVAG